ncbi:MAG: DUF3795 domain-containing protein [Actinobacteria bacterium]|nr:DUF3795 domain-containing protein [Actinomycetota bacterium]
MTNLSKELIAPCGMNCGICSNYLAYKNNISGKGFPNCIGCRARNKQCAFLKKRCIDDLKLLKGEIEFCFECNYYPCEILTVLDKRYRERFGMSMIDNLNEIKSKGINYFIENQEKKYRCKKCGNLISVHSNKCFACDKIISWKC